MCGLVYAGANVKEASATFGIIAADNLTMSLTLRLFTAGEDVCS